MSDPWSGGTPYDNGRDTKLDAEIEAAVARLPRAIIVGCCYLVAIPALGGPFGKAGVVALVVIVLGAAQIGRRVAEYCAVILAAYALALWFGAAPAPAMLRALVERAVALLGLTT